MPWQGFTQPVTFETGNQQIPIRRGVELVVCSIKGAWKESATSSTVDCTGPEKSIIRTHHQPSMHRASKRILNLDVVWIREVANLENGRQRFATHGGTVSKFITFERGREGRRVAVQCSQRATHHARSRIARTQWNHPDVVKLSRTSEAVDSSRFRAVRKHANVTKKPQIPNAANVEEQETIWNGEQQEQKRASWVEVVCLPPDIVREQLSSN